MDLNQGRDTHTGKGMQPFDRVFVPKGQPEFKESALRVLDDFQALGKLSPPQFRSRYSDHYMVVAEIRVMKDDD